MGWIPKGPRHGEFQRRFDIKWKHVLKTAGPTFSWNSWTIQQNLVVVLQWMCVLFSWSKAATVLLFRFVQVPETVSPKKRKSTSKKRKVLQDFWMFLISGSFPSLLGIFVSTSLRIYTPWNEQFAPENMLSQKETSRALFQPSFFRCCVSFKGCPHLAAGWTTPMLRKNVRIWSVQGFKGMNMNNFHDSVDGFRSSLSDWNISQNRDLKKHTKNKDNFATTTETTSPWLSKIKLFGISKNHVKECFLPRRAGFWVISHNLYTIYLYNIGWRISHRWFLPKTFRSLIPR